jgi:hypothetical protein
MQNRIIYGINCREGEYNVTPWGFGFHVGIRVLEGCHPGFWCDCGVG